MTFKPKSTEYLRKAQRARAKPTDSRGFLPKEFLPYVASFLLLALFFLFMAKKKGNANDKGKGKGKLPVRGGKGKGKWKASAKGKGKKGGKDAGPPNDGENVGVSSEEEVPPAEPPTKLKKPRGQSKGVYGKDVPLRRINLSGNELRDNEAKKTLLAIIRANWPIGYYNWTEISKAFPHWIDGVVAEFYVYYKHMRGHSRSQGRAAIEKHIKKICRQDMNNEKQRSLNRSKLMNKPLIECQPDYLGEEFYKWLVSVWEDTAHKKRSEAASANRAKVKHLHSCGTQSFGLVEEIMTEERGGMRPDRVSLWNRCHTRKSGELRGRLTPEAEEIAGRYAAIVDSVPPELRPDVEPIEWWLQATNPSGELPKKDRLLMFPNTPASQLLPNLAHSYRQSRRNQAGGSSASAASRHRSTIPDRHFLAIVQGVIGQARAHPDLYGQRELSDAEIRTLATNVLEASGAAGGATGQALQEFVTGEVIRVIGDILDDILRRYQREALEGEGRGSNMEDADLTEDEGGGSGGGGGIGLGDDEDVFDDDEEDGERGDGEEDGEDDDRSATLSD